MADEGSWRWGKRPVVLVLVRANRALGGLAGDVVCALLPFPLPLLRTGVVARPLRLGILGSMFSASSEGPCVGGRSEASGCGRGRGGMDVSAKEEDEEGGSWDIGGGTEEG